MRTHRPSPTRSSDRLDVPRSVQPKPNGSVPPRDPIVRPGSLVVISTPSADAALDARHPAPRGGPKRTVEEVGNYESDSGCPAGSARGNPPAMRGHDRTRVATTLPSSRPRFRHRQKSQEVPCPQPVVSLQRLAARAAQRRPFRLRSRPVTPRRSRVRPSCSSHRMHSTGRTCTPEKTTRTQHARPQTTGGSTDGARGKVAGCPRSAVPPSAPCRAADSAEGTGSPQLNGGGDNREARERGPCARGRSRNCRPRRRARRCSRSPPGTPPSGRRTGRTSSPSRTSTANRSSDSSSPTASAPNASPVHAGGLPRSARGCLVQVAFIVPVVATIVGRACRRDASQGHRGLRQRNNVYTLPRSAKKARILALDVAPAAT